jgi:hypothetical protein
MSSICMEILLIDWLIGWCLTPSLSVFQLYRGVNKLYINIRHLTWSLETKHFSMYKKNIKKDKTIYWELMLSIYIFVYKSISLKKNSVACDICK